MTHTLTAFMELMDHGIVSWENLSFIFIKKVLYLLLPCWLVDFIFYFFINAYLFCFSAQIASFVNAKVTDESIQQVSLDILESMVLSSHGLFVQVKQEVTMERLIAHLQV